MNDKLAELIHYASVISAEVTAALVLAIILFAMLMYRENRKSSKCLFVAILAELLFLVGDAASFYNLSISTLPIGVTYISYFVSYVFGLLVVLPFSLYSKAFIEEKTTVGKWTYRIPILIGIISIAIAVAAILSGSVYGVVEGKLAEINGLPPIVGLLQIFIALYLPSVAFTKRKYIGLKAVLLLGFFGLCPIVLFFVSYNYAGAGTALSLAVVYVLLQCDTSVVKEKQRQELLVLNQRLTDSNEENLAQLEEIKALNDQLRDNQSQLEELTTEQEAQIEEISALNSTLEENQSQLEEAAAENEAQLEEITAAKYELETYQAALEEAKQAADDANAAKTSFLFNMSHDIRTPMNAIIGFTNLLEKHQEEPARRKDYLAKIQDSSAVLLSIINNVLEMARIEKGTIQLEETVWNAKQFNDTLFEVYEEMMKDKGISFTRSLKVEHNYLSFDPVKLREVFMNLLSNAYKYTNSGGSVHMNVEEIPSPRKGYAYIRTTISDTGMGMSEKFLPHIFEEFARENNTTENKIEGTGLGMPIVKRLVELMGGTIEVTSTKGVGSTFVVTIPHGIAAETNVEHYGDVEIDPKLFKNKRILLAEDNDLNAEIATEILTEVGFILERAEDGLVCVNKLRESKPGYYDVILMDIQMPHMNGYEATRTIRALQDSAKANIPILAMTANAYEEDRREAMKTGMNGHIAKPIDISELMRSLTRVL